MVVAVFLTILRNVLQYNCNHVSLHIHQAKSQPGTIRGDFCIQIGRQVLILLRISIYYIIHSHQYEKHT